MARELRWLARLRLQCVIHGPRQRDVAVSNVRDETSVAAFTRHLHALPLQRRESLHGTNNGGDASTELLCTGLEQHRVERKHQVACVRA
mgnify:CR=1 FL=1